MEDCSKCKHSLWDYDDAHPFRRLSFIHNCNLDNDPEDCQDFEEYEGGDE